MKTYNQKTSPISQWNEKDRPREKLQNYGKSVLTDAELIAILIGSGSREETAIDLCKRILEESNNDLINLGQLSIEDLMKFKGIGEAKAITIIAALELGRRRQSENSEKIKKITCSKDVYRLFLADLADLPYEEFWVLYVNNSNKIISKECVSKGGISATVVDVRPILKKALIKSSSAIFLIHNHPSGTLKPSAADLKITKKLKEAAKIMDMQILDHLIISSEGYYSFADEGKL